MPVTDIDVIIDLKEFISGHLLRLGNDLMITGAVYGNSEEAWLVWLPEEEMDRGGSFNIVVDCDSEGWKRILQQTDTMETEILAKAKDGSLVKSIMRKSARQVDQKIAWNVYRRDNYTCVYCRRSTVPLTIDHIVLWEEGGATVENNLLSACKNCNKDRSNTPFLEFCKVRSVSSLVLGDRGHLTIDEIWEAAEKTPRKYNIASR